MVDADAGISANVGRIEGGRARNIVPAEASLSAEIRTDRRADLERLYGRLLQMAESPFTPGVRVELTNVARKQPLEPGAETLRYLKTAEAVAAQLGQTFETGHRGGVSDGNILCADRPDLICLDGMGPSGWNAHSPEEYLLLDSVEPSIKLMAALLAAL